VPWQRHICHRVRADFGLAESMTDQITARPLASRRPRPNGTRPADLTTARGAALYIGALLGPGLLLLPGIAAAEAGPASIVAWLGLLGLSGMFAAVFSALGQSYPQAGGVVGYVTAGLGSRAGRIAGWSFLCGVVTGAPIVCLIGASYVASFAGGGRLVRAGVAAALLFTVLALTAAGLRNSARAQVALVALLVALVAVATVGSGGAAHIGNWSPFAPHGWLSVGHAATTLMLSFVGWEAVAPMTTRFTNPSRQLPRVIAIAVAATTMLYLGLAIATISVLGHRTATLVPLAVLLHVAIGPPGTAAAAVAAVVLTAGAINAYVNGAALMWGQLAGPVSWTPHGRARRSPPPLLAALIALAGGLLITLDGLGLVSTASLVMVPTALFLAVYLASMLAAARMLRGPVRAVALPATVAVLVMLAYCGPALLLPAVVAVAADWTRTRRRTASFGGHQP
jgi:amino acid efflux transporter